MSDLTDIVRSVDLIARVGKVSRFYGLSVESQGPDVFVGEICEIYASHSVDPVLAEVVGFKDGRVILMPYGNLTGLQVGSEVIATGKIASFGFSEDMLGHVIDAFGVCLEKNIAFSCTTSLPLYAKPINPMDRKPIDKIFGTGVKVIDTFLTLGEGQRIGLFAGSGVGKSTLLGMLSNHADADVNVIALIGERGREVAEFVHDSLGRSGMTKTVLVAATADAHPLVRTRAAYAATAIAEYFSGKGKSVFLAMDSITRFAMAQREIGLAAGEPPTTKGYTPSAFSALPRLVERAGNFLDRAPITSVYTVLAEGDDMNDPVVDHSRAILDGHIVLSRRIANKGHYPAVDVLQSISRLRNSLISDRDRECLAYFTGLLSRYDESRDMIEMGLYKKGGSEEIDKSVVANDFISRFFCQKYVETYSRSDSMEEVLTEMACLRGGLRK